MKRIIALTTAAIIAALTTTLMLTVTTGAIQFSDTNKDIEILYGEFTGYRFNGPDAPGDGVNTAKIAKVKFYIKCPDLESIELAPVQLIYNSGTTGWVETDHDLNDGLIIEVDVPGVVEGDFFDAALGTWNEEITGTFSVELRDADDNVIGVGVYESTPEPVTPPVTEEQGPKEGTLPPQTSAESPGETLPPKDGTYAPQVTTVPQVTAVQETTVAVPDTIEPPPVTTPDITDSNVAGSQNNPNTGSANIITGMMLTAASALVIVAARRKK
jgi:hypothetical protein